MKFFVQGTAKDHKELDSSILRISCRNLQQVGITYFRYARWAGAGAGTPMRLAAGDRGTTLSSFGSVVKTNAIESGARTSPGERFRLSSFSMRPQHTLTSRLPSRVTQTRGRA